MKLRNKKTGEIVEDTDILAILAYCKYDIPLYRSLAALNADWEDYTIPRIGDDKVREAVKLWLMISLYNNKEIVFDELMNGFYLLEENSDRVAESISFPDNIKFNLEDGKHYTITELCGEEE